MIRKLKRRLSLIKRLRNRRPRGIKEGLRRKMNMIIIGKNAEDKMDM
jgi:hypothetical protein